MRALALAAAVCCAAALVSAQYGPPRKHKKPHAPLPPLEEQAPAEPPPDFQSLPSAPAVSSTPPPDNSIEPGRGDYWWMASGGSIFSQPGAVPPGPAPPSPLPPAQGCGGGGGYGGGGGGCGGGSSGPGSYPDNPFLSGGGPKPTPSAPSQFVVCTQTGHVCVPLELCRNGVVIQNGRGLFDLRTGQCDISTHVCCYKPAPQQSQPGCTGQPGQFVCGGLGPDDHQAPTPAPSQPGLVHIAPASRPRPAGGYGGAPEPAKPGLIHIAPGQASGPGIVHISPGQPAQPGSVTYNPDQPAQPGSVSYAPGQPSQPGSVSYTPGRPAQPGSVSYTPGQPAQPGSAVYTPGQPAQPGSVVYTPGQPAQPGSVTYSRPGTSGVPIGGSIYDATTARSVYSSTTQRAYTGPLNTTPYPGCAAALKCVPEELCTAEGVMTDTPVHLTREQAELRVPLTECADPETGRLGKCCRDPNYEDPWPGGMMMAGPGAAHPNKSPVDECGPAANCLHPYQCADANKIIPAKGCRVPLDGASGMCCAFDSASYPAAAASIPHVTTAKPGAAYYSPGKPAQPPSVAYKPPTPAQPGTATYTPGVPAQPGSVSYTPGVPAQPSSVSYTPGVPAQPGSVSYTPGSPAKPGSVSYQPGTPAHPDQVSYQPGTPAHPDQVSYQPGTPARPGSVSYTPGTPAQPGSASYTPGVPAQPGSVTHQPGTPAQPGSVSYQPGTPGTPGTVSINPGKPARPGSATYGGAAPQHPGSLAQSSTPAPVAVSPDNPGGPRCGIAAAAVQPGETPTEAGYSDLPWQALVLSVHNGSALCSGALISSRAVVTSAHCIGGLRSSVLVVRVGVWRLHTPPPDPLQEVAVVAIARHPDQDGGSLANDVAVLMLERDVFLSPHVNPICLPPSGADQSYQRNCVASGWGKAALQSNQAGAPLNKVPVSFVPNAQCEETLRQTHLGKYFILHRSFQCAVPQSHNLCLVDAGGPIGCDRGDGRFFLAGVYSWDVGCTATSNPAVLAGIDVTWIQSVLLKPVKEISQAEDDEIRRQELIGQSTNTDTKPGFSQGYGRK